ncbi:MAG: hypothetical protein H7039_11855 [Bryobacteraceae bacterium]|nr:hypothetical protein [Bryobacteraceae bacterium]
MASDIFLPNRTDLAGSWFLDSGIRYVSGGFARFYGADLGKNRRLSTEITGYSISALAYLYQRTGETRYLIAAKDAADFLVNAAWLPSPGIWPFEYPTSDGPEPLTYFFDTGIIVRGLLALWRINGSQGLLDAAIAGGESMNLFSTCEAGVHNPILSLPSLQPLAYQSQWSRSPGCYQLKSALAWRELSVVTGRSDFRDSWVKTATWAIRHADAFLPAETRSKTMDRLHAYLYFLEAMLFEHEENVLSRGITMVSHNLRKIRDEFERADVNAQLLRIRLLAHQAGLVPWNEVEGREEARRIATFQALSDDERLHGGYFFGRRGPDLVPHVNPVSTAFCLQALEMLSDFDCGKKLDEMSLI